MQKMEKVAWMLILLCAANFVSSVAHEDAEMLIRSKDFLISSNEVSLSDLQHHENITLTEKAQRGKGSYGGANLVHRKPGDKNDALLSSPCFFFFSTILAFTFFLFFFH